MGSLLKVGLAVVLALAAAAVCGHQGAQRDAQDGFDTHQYVEEEFREFFEIEQKAGAAHRLPEQPLLPNVS